MDAGLLRDRIVIERVTKTSVSTGVTNTWSTVGTYWGRLIEITAEARANFQHLDARTTHKAVIRGDVGISFSGHRIKIGDRVFRPLQVRFEPGAASNNQGWTTIYLEFETTATET